VILEPLVGKTLRDRWRSLVAWSLGIGALVTVQMAVYPTIRDSSADMEGFTESLPEAFQEMFRMEDYTSPAGYLSTELLSFVVPFIFMTLGATWGARSASEEEESGTADVMFSLPIERRDYVVTRWLTASIVLLGEAIVFGVALVIGSSILDMGIAIGYFANASLMMLLAGSTSHSLAAVVGTRTGKRSVGLGTTMVALIAGFVVYSLAPLVDFFDAVNPFNPLQWMLGTRPLTTGVDLGYVLLLLLVSALGLVASVRFFDRRDIQV
jgi:ABC-2 type transport system permease protein